MFKVLNQGAVSQLLVNIFEIALREWSAITSNWIVPVMPATEVYVELDVAYYQLN